MTHLVHVCPTYLVHEFTRHTQVNDPIQIGPACDFVQQLGREVNETELLTFLEKILSVFASGGICNILLNYIPIVTLTDL